MKDIETRDDIEFLINEFYGKVRMDERLSPVFRHMDWAKHLPAMYRFWSSIILGEQSYKGAPVNKHFTLPLEAPDFNQWLLLFHTTVDENFSGGNAEQCKGSAMAMSGVFQDRLGLKSN